ncbi:MAG TPA: aminotransferase class I/II-fold pyridoxal phosphate-dependent enzyme [Rectinemataceae bacterium]|nr:aminotransferase class I/II-fold pyridoxal phosphate-dependent enzyme [Rectinemataceae bacterium]
MNALAEEANKVLDGSAAGRLLSGLGRRMYFPKGILTQSAEAGVKAKRFNATIGMAYEGGEPMILDAVRAALPGLSASEAVAYASTGGVAELRQRWKLELARKNPSLASRSYSLPVVVPGLTAAVSYLADLFLDEGDAVVLPDLHWPNYRLIVEERKQATGLTFPVFAAGGAGGALGFNVAGMAERLAEAGAKRGKAVCILNFPNNPTGYSPTETEAEAIVSALVAEAEKGTDILVIADDAYFGLQYERNLLGESIFARLTDAHPRILTVKADGPTKEDYVWGFRLGFVTFAGKDLSEARQEALVKKLMGVVRSSVSSSSAPAQNIFLKALDSPGYEAQKRRYRELLEGRFREAKKAVSSGGMPASLRALPFNSGYFMSFECRGISAEALRVKLLEERGIGTISMQDRYLRVAFSSVEEGGIAELYREIAAAAVALEDAGR